MNTIKAIINAQVSNATNYANEKELISAYSVIGNRDGELHEFVTVRCYMGRSKAASTIYASIWVHGKEIYTSGSGSAGGYGYHKVSAAIQHAINNAEIQLYGTVYDVQRYNYDEKREYTEDERKIMLRKAMKTRCYIDGVGESAINEAIKAIARAAGAKGKLIVVFH